MTIDLSSRKAVGRAALTLALTAWGAAVIATGPANATSADCGVHLLPSLDPTGAHAFGGILDLTEDGVYVGSATDGSGVERAAYWIDEVAHEVPVDLVGGELLDVTEGHLSVGYGYDEENDRVRGYVFDIDAAAVTWLPGIGGSYVSARRINEHGVAVGDGISTNGTSHPLRWSPPYVTAERLPKLGGTGDGLGGWAAGNNDRGDVVGSIIQGRLTPDKRDYGGVPADFHIAVTHVMAWDPQPERLGEAGPQSQAFDVNNERRAVGGADVVALDRTMPTYWSLDDKRLHVMGSPVTGTDGGLATGVSEGGWAAGLTETYFEDEFVLRHAFVWTGSGDVRMLPGADAAWEDTWSMAHGVSDVRDEVTGISSTHFDPRPTVWRCASLISVVASQDAS
jgi:hypothetical protein